jgi:hypothetical protein
LWRAKATKTGGQNRQANDTEDFNKDKGNMDKDMEDLDEVDDLDEANSRDASKKDDSGGMKVDEAKNGQNFNGRTQSYQKKMMEETEQIDQVMNMECVEREEQVTEETNIQHGYVGTESLK